MTTPEKKSYVPDTTSRQQLNEPHEDVPTEDVVLKMKKLQGK